MIFYPFTKSNTRKSKNIECSQVGYSSKTILKVGDIPEEFTLNFISYTDEGDDLRALLDMSKEELVNLYEVLGKMLST